MIEQEIKEITAEILARAERGEVSQRDIALLLEVYAKLDDYYAEIQDLILSGEYDGLK